MKSEEKMMYITYKGDYCRDYVNDYNTKNYSVTELVDICDEWTREDQRKAKMGEDDNPHEYYIIGDDGVVPIIYKAWGDEIDICYYFTSQEDAEEKIDEWIEEDKKEFGEVDESVYHISEYKQDDIAGVFAAIMTSARARLGMTIQEMALSIGVPQRTLEEWIAGRHSPSAITREAVLGKIDNLEKSR